MITMQNFVKKAFVSFLILVFGFAGLSYASTGDTASNQNGGAERCVENKYDVVGNFNIKPGQAKYQIEKKEILEENKIKSLEYSLRKNGELIEKKETRTYSHNFLKPGKVTLTVKIKEEKGCEYKIEKNINVYKKIVVYIGKKADFFGFFEVANQLDKKNIYFKKIVLGKEGILSEDEIAKNISQDVFFLNRADNMIINTSKFATIFEAIAKVRDLYDLSLQNKQIMLVTDIRKNFLKKFLAKYLNTIDLKRIYVTKTDRLINLIKDIGDPEKKVHEQFYMDLVSVSIQDVPKHFFLSYVVDYLVYEGIPINLLGLIMSIFVSVILINIFRQIIGFSVFGVFNPILFAISMLAFGAKLSLILLFVVFLATIIVKFVTKKLYLLYSAKVSMLIIFYLLIALVVLWADNFFGFNQIDYSVFLNSLVIFPIVFIVIAGNKVFRKKSNFLKLGWWVYFGEFLIVSFSIYGILIWTTLQYYLLAYPEILILMVVLNIIIGRFTGLQLLEYLRFMPLIKKHFEEE